MALTKQFNITDGGGVLTLSGGARLAAASGGLPQRITMELDGLVPSVMSGRSGVVWDPDGAHVWVSSDALSRVRKVRVSDGVAVTEFTNNTSDGGTRTITNPYLGSRRGTKLYFACGAAAGPYVGEIDTDTLVCRLYSQPGYPATGLGHVFCAEPGKVWYRNAHTTSGTYREGTLAGSGDSAAITDTGQTITGWDGAGDNEGLRAYVATGTGITWIDLATDVQTALSPFTTAINGLTGYGNSFRGLVWDPITNAPILQNGNQQTDHWGRVTRNASTGALTGWGVRVTSLTDYGGVGFYRSTDFSRPAFAISPDGSKLAIAVATSNASVSALTSVRIVNLGVQRARWAWTPAQSIRMTRIHVPGDFAACWGAVENMSSSPSWLQSVYDLRRVSFWYSVNGGARVAFDPGAPLAVDVPAGQQILIDVDMQHTLENLIVPFRPRLGAIDGVSGPAVEYTRADARERLRGAA